MCDPHLPARAAFADDTLAAEHLCDHVLTRPEAHDWALLIPDYRAHADPTDDPALRDLAASLFGGLPLPAALALRQGYVAAILRAIDDALRLGMWWEERTGGDTCWVGLGLEGVLVIWDRAVIRSGYLPRNSTLPPGGPVPPRAVNPLPRRDTARRLAPPPPDTPRSRYELFRASHFSVSRLYEIAYYNGKIPQAGGDAYAEPRAPRIGKWQELVARRPPRDAGIAGGYDGTAGSESA